MIFRVIPYELVENLFGTWVADNFNKINLILLVIGFLCWALFGDHSKKTTVTKREVVQKPTDYVYYMDENGCLVQEKQDRTQEEMELAKQIKIDHSQPSFEEWKAAREREQGKGE